MTGTDVALSACAYCGARIRAGVRHPTYTATNDAGDLRLYVFCDEDCKAAWLSDADEPVRE